MDRLFFVLILSGEGNLIQHFFRLCSIVSRETICIKFANNFYAMSDYRMNVCDARFVTFAKRSG